MQTTKSKFNCTRGIFKTILLIQRVIGDYKKLHTRAAAMGIRYIFLADGRRRRAMGTGPVIMSLFLAPISTSKPVGLFEGIVC